MCSCGFCFGGFVDCLFCFVMMSVICYWLCWLGGFSSLAASLPPVLWLYCLLNWMVACFLVFCVLVRCGVGVLLVVCLGALVSFAVTGVILFIVFYVRLFLMLLLCYYLLDLSVFGGVWAVVVFLGVFGLWFPGTF